MDRRFKDWKHPEFDEKGTTKWNWMCQYHENLKLGKETDIGAFTYINAKYGVEIEENVQIGSHCSIYSWSTIDDKRGKVTIKKNARVGAHTVIMPGVTIGKNAVIGACSLVSENIPDNVECDSGRGGASKSDKAENSLIQKHYVEQAEKFGTSGISTISDINIRKLEINALLRYLEDSRKVLEVGCGNGYSAVRIIEQRNIDLIGIDASEEMIKMAKARTIVGAKGKVQFALGNALRMNFQDEFFDAIFTERCLINITNWEDQKVALEAIARVLKVGGLFIMLECFTDGWRNMNEARAELGLKEIPQPWHDLFFDKEEVARFMNSKFELFKEDNFLSTYFFGSRVLYPALLPKGQEPRYDSQINSFFAHLPSFGNHSSIKILLFRKVKAD